MQELIPTLQRIQIVSAQLAKDVLAGAYRSAFKGKGMEFEEVREYIPGDDIRTIDWNVTARMNAPYIKNFREERDLTVFLLVDISGSTRFGTQYQTKRQLLSEIGGVLAFSAIKNNDRVGLILFSDKIEKYIPPRKGTRHVLRLIRELLSYQPEHTKTNLQVPLSFFGHLQNRSSICFLLSDFQAKEDYHHEVSILAKKHDLISICVTDPAEKQLPNVNIVEFADLETGQNGSINTSNKELLIKQELNYTDHILKQRNHFESIGASFIEIKTNDPYLSILRQFFTLRRKKRAA